MDIIDSGLHPMTGISSVEIPIFVVTRQLLVLKGPGSVLGIATRYGLAGPGNESRRGPDFPHLPRPALGPAQPPVHWVPGFSPGVKSGWGVTLTPHPLLVLWSGKSSPYGPYGLYWASVPVQGCTLHLPLLVLILVLKLPDNHNVDL